MNLFTEDWDLKNCLYYNGQDDFDYDDIGAILARVDGERDGSMWHWVLQLTNGKYVLLQGGCDYTGWDCQSWAVSEICAYSPFALLADTKLDVSEQVGNELLRQLSRGAFDTVRQRVGQALFDTHKLEAAPDGWWACRQCEFRSQSEQAAREHSMVRIETDDHKPLIRGPRKVDF